MLNPAFFLKITITLNNVFITVTWYDRYTSTLKSNHSTCGILNSSNKLKRTSRYSFEETLKKLRQGCKTLEGGFSNTYQAHLLRCGRNAKNRAISVKVRADINICIKTLADGTKLIHNGCKIKKIRRL